MAPGRGPSDGAQAQPGTDGVDRVEEDWRRERPDIDIGSVGIITRIWRLSRHLDRERRDRLTELGTDRVTIDVLAMLRRAGAPYTLSAAELARHSLITSGGVSQRLRKLEAAGLIRRHVDLDDRRRVDVELTAEGMRLIDSVVSELMAHESKLLDELSDRDQHDLRRTLKILLARFEREDPADEAPDVAI